MVNIYPMNSPPTETPMPKSGPKIAPDNAATIAELKCGLARLQAITSEQIESLALDFDEAALSAADAKLKSLTALLKFMDGLDAQISRWEAQEKARRYTPYDEFPPPSPEDAARIRARLVALYDHISAVPKAEVDLSVGPPD